MLAVLYTHQLEPITVVDIPMWAWERLSRGDCVRLHVPEPVRINPMSRWDSLTYQPRVVEIFGDKLRRGEHETLMLFTGDEESALLLKADFLPGQRGEAQRRERGAFAAGVLRAFQALGDQGPE